MSNFDVVHVPTGLSISDYVIMIDPATDTGTGEIPSAVVMLNAENGQFISQNGGGLTPILAQFDQFQLVFIDDNNFVFKKKYYLENMIPRKNLQEGIRLELHLLGREKWVQEIDFPYQFYFHSGFLTILAICDFYNGNKGASQPSIVNQGQLPNYNPAASIEPLDGYVAQGNLMPTWTSNVFDFSATEISCYDGIMEILEKQGNTAQSGGVNDFFECRFDDDDSNVNNIKIEVFSSGSTAKAGTPVVITAQAVNMPEAQGGIESQQATLVKVWGADDQGSLPVDFSQFNGINLSYFENPLWQSGVPGGYPIGASVEYDNGSGIKVYQNTLANNTNTPGGTGWTLMSEASYLGALQYSPWTNGKNVHWRNCGADDNNNFFGNACWDGNLVIQDGTYYRTPVDLRTPDLITVAAGITLFKWQINTAGSPPSKQFYRGFRVLADTTLGPIGGIFAQNGGKDRFGNSYANAVIMHNGTVHNVSGTQYKSWDVMIGQTLSSTNTSQALQVLNQWQVAVRSEAKNYQYSTGLLGWTDASGQAKRNDCFHVYTSLTTDTGVSNIAKSGGGTYGDNSALKVQYQFNVVDIIAGLFVTTKPYYSAGAWLNWAVPFPLTTDGGISGDVGSLYGGSGLNVPEPATLDSLNMKYTHTGNVGFNHADSVDLGPLSALTFQLKILLSASGSITTPLSLFGSTYADIPCRAILYDTNDNVAIQDFKVPFNNVWYPASLPLNQFQIYRARIPLQWGDINSLVPPPQLNIQNVFLWRNIKQMCIQIQDVYDDQGRYKPEGSRLIQWMMSTAPTSQNCVITMWLDAFNFTKPLLSTSGPVSNYNIETKTFQRKNIINKVQLDGEALSLLAIYQFKHIEYEVTTDFRCDIAFGDSFYFSDPDVVPASFTDYLGQPSTIKLVNKRTSYTLNKKDGPGGLLTTFLGVKRLNAN